MPRSPAQSDFVVYPEVPAVAADDELPDAASPVQLPTAIVRSNEASPLATKLVMGFTFVVLLALVLLCAIGPHIPSGE